MLRRKLKTMLVLSGMAISSGCASDGLRMPLRDTFTSLGRELVPGAGEKQELSKEFREAQKVFTKDPEGSLLAWARWQEDTGEYAEARKRYRELLIAYPDNVEAQLGLARIELSCGRVKQAEDILLEVAKNRPENAPVRLELGRLYTQQEDWEKAIASFEEASAVNPEDQVCRYELGVAFARSHRFDQALSHLTFSVGESAAHYNIGYIMHEQGNDADAIEWFQNALQSHPDPRTAERTRMMLAQVSPSNTRGRNTDPTYPSAEPSSEFLAARSRQNDASQYEPRSFEAPAIRPASIIRREASEQVLPYVSTNGTKPVQDNNEVLLPPVNYQAAQSVMTASAPQYSESTPTGSPFQTVSHSTPQEFAGPQNGGKTPPPQWKGAADRGNVASATMPPQQHSGSPMTKWRGREN